MAKDREYTLTLKHETLAAVHQDYGHRCIDARQGFVFVYFEGEPSKEIARLASAFPEGSEKWSIYPAASPSVFDVTSEQLHERVEEAVYCGPVRP